MKRSTTTDKRQAPLQKMAFTYDIAVKEEGQTELTVPLPSGARVTVFVIEESGEKFDDLMLAAQSSLDFWDNPVDDEDWNIDGHCLAKSSLERERPTRSLCECQAYGRLQA